MLKAGTDLARLPTLSLCPETGSGMIGCMGTVHKLKRPPKNERQFGGYKPELKIGARARKNRLRWNRAVLVPAAWIVILCVVTALAVLG